MRLKLLLLGIGLMILGFALAFITCPSGSCSNDAPSVISGLLALAGIVTIPASIILSLRDRELVSGPPVTSTSATFLDDLAKRLTSAGFSVRRDFDISPYRLDLLADRSKFELSKFGKLTRFVAVSRSNSVDIARVQDFSASVTKFALDNPGTLLPRGLGGGVFVIPVLVSTGQGRVYYCGKTPVWGAAYYLGLRKFVKSMIGRLSPE